MNPTLARLTQLIPPPPSPVAAGAPEDWLQVEAYWGTKLPQDYKDYINFYGAGQWAGYFGIWNPFYQWKHPDATKDWKAWMETQLEFLEKWQIEYPGEVVPFPRYPAPGGLLPFGYDDSGGTICWLTTGDPDSWTIVYLDDAMRHYEHLKMPLSAFLVEFLAEKMPADLFPEDLFPLTEPVFEPYTSQ